MNTPNDAASSQSACSTAASKGSSGASQSQKQRMYRGVRPQGEKWVSEIRERRKSGRIWLGMYPTPEMAAAAYDAASLALKWPNAVLNFPDQASTYPIPASLAALDIQIAAAAAAAATREPPHEPAALEQAGLSHHHEAEYIYEEEMFDMPSLLADMAEGMIMTPPTVICDSDPGQYFEGDSLWSF